MKLQEFIQLCADEDILLTIIDDETGVTIIDKVWKSDKGIIGDVLQREVQSCYLTENGYNVVMEIYVK